MAEPAGFLAALRRVRPSEWAWWLGTAVLWPLWLLLVLGAQLVVYVGVAAFRVPIYGALLVAVVAAALASIAGSWFVGGTTAVNGAPRRLWSVPAVYGALAVAGIVVVDVVQWTQGVPGPLPWTTATTIGFVVFTTVGVVPALGAVAFRVGVRSAGPQIPAAPSRSEVAAPPR